MARTDLEEALDYASVGGHTLLEVDIRVGLAWAQYRAGNGPMAEIEAEGARRMSTQMGYHWGQVDAAEILAQLR